MTRLLLYIKQRVPSLWYWVEWLNGTLFKILHRNRVLDEANKCCNEFYLDGYEFRVLTKSDLDSLAQFLENQPVERVEYFKPHKFDRCSLESAFENPAFLMFGGYRASKLVGYFSLRCFWNRRAFVGRLVDKREEGRGVGRVMSQILHNTAWRAAFRCHTTISKNNAMVVGSHAKGSNIVILQELPNDYLFVEFLPPKHDGDKEVASEP